MKSLLGAIFAAFIVGLTLGHETNEDVMTAIQCSQNCIEAGMSGGYYKDGQCVCFKPDKEIKSTSEVRTPCDKPRCNKACWKSGWNGGVCEIDGSCWCYDFGTGETEEIPLTETQPAPTKKSDVMTAIQCSHNCIEAGMSGGYYKDGQCWCFKPLKEIKSSPEVRTPCDKPRCNKACLKSGYNGGVCQKDESCWCYDFGTGEITQCPLIETQPAPTEKSETIFSEKYDESWRDRRECVQNCISAGMKGGYFEDGKCTCF